MVDLDRHDPQTLTDLRAVKEQLAAEVDHLPLREGFRELLRRARATHEELHGNKPLPADGTHG